MAGDCVMFAEVAGWRVAGDCVMLAEVAGWLAGDRAMFAG